MPGKGKTTQGKQTRKANDVRDEKFADLIAKGVQPSEAYVKAGFRKTKNVSVLANHKLNSVTLTPLLEQRKAYFRSIADVEAAQIIGAQQEIAFASIEDALDNNGNLDFVKAKANGSVKLIKRISRQATKYGESVSVEFYSRTDALSQLADMLGLKQMPKTNLADAELVKLRNAIEAWAKKKGTTYETEVRLYLDNFSETVKPEIKDKLVSELGTVG